MYRKPFQHKLYLDYGRRPVGYYKSKSLLGDMFQDIRSNKFIKLTCSTNPFLWEFLVENASNPSFRCPSTLSLPFST